MPTLKQLREAKGLTQQELATQAGLSINVVGRMEAGNPVHKSSLFVVATALGVRPEEITGIVVRSVSGGSAAKK